MTPVRHTSTTREIKDGWGGSKPLPVTEFSGGKNIAWVPTNSEIKQLRRGAYISMVILDDGSISMKVGSIETYKPSELN